MFHFNSKWKENVSLYGFFASVLYMYEEFKNQNDLLCIYVEGK
jgi:hypothetical protein